MQRINPGASTGASAEWFGPITSATQSNPRIEMLRQLMSQPNVTTGAASPELRTGQNEQSVEPSEVMRRQRLAEIISQDVPMPETSPNQIAPVDATMLAAMGNIGMNVWEGMNRKKQDEMTEALIRREVSSRGEADSTDIASLMNPATSGLAAERMFPAQEKPNIGATDPQSYTPESFQRFMQSGDFSQLEPTTSGLNDPAQVRSIQGLSEMGGLTEEEIQEAVRVELGLSSRAGQSRIVDIAGVPTLVGTTGGGQEFQVPLSSIQGEAEGRGTIAGAETAAQESAKTAEIPERTRVETQTQDFAQAPARLQASRDIMTNVQNLNKTFEDVLANANLWTTGFLGRAGSYVAGTPQANLAANLNQIQANAAFDRLQEMRDASQTGGALGQVSERELDLLRDAQAAIGQSQSPEQFRTNVARLQEQYQRTAELAKKASEMDTIKARIGALQSRSQTPETQSQIDSLFGRLYEMEDRLWQEVDSDRPTDAPAEQRSVPSPGDEMDGYRFKGGDPADENNWELIGG